MYKIVLSFFLFLTSITIAQEVSVTQSAPEIVEVYNEFIVEFNIDKKSGNGYAKLIQELPNGFTAIEEDSNNGLFSFENNIVSVVWRSLPAESNYTVRYKVLTNYSALGQHQLNATFSYLSNIIETSMDVSPISITVKNKDEEPYSSLEKSEVAEEYTSEEINQEIVNAAALAEAEEAKKAKMKELLSKYNNGITYRVQILALSKAKTAKEIEQYFGLDYPVTLESDGNLTRYTVGVFISYEKAEAMRDALKLINDINTAKINTYNKGKRISNAERKALIGW